jgi:hypothetical protein
MPIDSCQRSFNELAQEVLPGYMAALRQGMAQPIPLSEFAVKGVGVASLLKRFGLTSDPRGCYVLLDNGRPVYVGISKSVITRLRQHVLGIGHLDATLAYRIAAMRHPHGMTASEAMTNASFRERFLESQAYLRELSVAFVEIQNPLELYVFEAYCAMELDTGFDNGGWNTFVTH